MSGATTWDVIVAGGGPAGSTAAAYLAMRGHKVLLLERDDFPRHHIGESLLPSMMPILVDFGLIEEVQACGFTKKTGGTFIWGKSREPWDVTFATNPFLPYPYAYHVDRAIFDDVLLRHARRRGVEVRTGVSVNGPVVEGDRVVGVAYSDEKGQGELRAKWVIDASGSSAVIGRKLTKRVYDEQMRQVAFYSYYKDIVGAKDHRANHIIIEANPWGWFWFIPMLGNDQTGDVSVGLVTGQEFQAEFKELGPEGFFDRAIAQAPVIQELLGPKARRIQKMRSIMDWAYTCERTAGPGFFLAGDAAAFLDPLLSTGCSMAMLAGYTSSVCINTLLKDPSMEDAALRFYAGNYRQMYEVTRDFLHYFYAGNTLASKEDLFWKARSVLNFSENVGARQAFCFFINTVPANPHPATAKQIDMYLKFMDQVQHPVDELQANAEKVAPRSIPLDARWTEELSDAAVPVPNGAVEETCEIDGANHVLRPIRGLAYDADRPIFSSTGSWLLGRNVHPLKDDAARLVEACNGVPWRQVLERLAGAESVDVDAARARYQPLLEEMHRQKLVLLQAGAAS